MSEIISVKDLAASGVKLLRYCDPMFESALSPTRGPAVDRLLPYTVVVSNETSQDIIAYSVRWNSVDGTGELRSSESTIFDQSTMRVMGPHSCQLVSPVPSLASWHSNEAHTQEQDNSRIDRLVSFYRKQDRIEVSLEVVIFSDGSSIGDDGGSWIPRIKAWIDAERDFVREIQDTPIEELEGKITQIKHEAVAALQTPEWKQIGLAMAANKSPSYDQAYRFAKGDFASQFLQSVKATGISAAIDFAQDLSSRKTWPNIHRANPK